MKFVEIIDTLRRTLVPVHREGWPFVGIFLAVAIVLGLFSSTLFWIGLILTGWCAYFFRDPERVTPVSDDFVLSPADGKISSITQAVPPPESGLGESPMTRVSIFMNVFSVHINRAPFRGQVKSVTHKPGKFDSAEIDKASTDNERSTMVIETPKGPAAVVQIAGLIARRIVSWAEKGETLAAGERYGLIRFGSRVDIYMPEGALVSVSVGQVTVAGETILARYDGASVHPVTRIS